MKSNHIQIRCTKEEKALWKDRARCAGLRLSEWIRTKAGEEKQSAIVEPAGPAPRVMENLISNDGPMEVEEIVFTEEEPKETKKGVFWA